MTDAELLLSGLRTVRLQALALAQAIENVLEIADRPSADLTGKPDNGVCRHPMARRIPTPVMGHPTRFRCGECHTEVEE